MSEQIPPSAEVVDQSFKEFAGELYRKCVPRRHQAADNARLEWRNYTYPPSNRLVRLCYENGQLSEALFEYSGPDEFDVCLVFARGVSELHHAQYLISDKSYEYWNDDMPKFELPKTSVEDFLRVFKFNIEWGDLELVTTSGNRRDYRFDARKDAA